MTGGYVLIAAATSGELSRLIEAATDRDDGRIGGRRVVSGIIGHKTVRLIVTGPGQVNASQSLTAAIEAGRPGLIIQTGCAGAFRGSGLGLGDIAIAFEEIDVHLGLESEAANDRHVRPLPFAVLEADGKSIAGRYPFDQALVKAAAKAVRGAEYIQGQIKTGPFVTVATITATDGTAARLEAAYQPVMENMEGAAAAHVALHYGLPMIEVRAASNIVEKRQTEKWDLESASINAATAVLAILNQAHLLPIPGFLEKKDDDVD